MTTAQITTLVEHAPAKVNLTLRVFGRRRDGMHGLESVVAFAHIGDKVMLALGREIGLETRGPKAALTGPAADNLILKAANALAREVPRLQTGHFTLIKHLPVAAGLGGGSADAAAALRLLARANNLALSDPRIFAAARVTGADVPVCLASRFRLMRGIGDVLSDPIEVEPMACVLANPGIAVETSSIFAALDRSQVKRDASEAETRKRKLPNDQAKLLAFLAEEPNELEPVAIAQCPPIGEVLNALRATAGCRLARMSGSGATCFGLFTGAREAAAAARRLAAERRSWWVAATELGSASAPSG
jgi:4-diphosphocytidyl-2-C-methyl-D-erythritol kinase